MIKNGEVLEKKITQKQSKTIILLLRGDSIEEIAKALQVSVSSIYRWLETDELFIKAYAEARGKIFSESIASLQPLSRDAVKTLKDLLLSGHKDTARLGSAKTILELAIKNFENEELEKRVEKLEDKLEEMR